MSSSLFTIPKTATGGAGALDRSLFARDAAHLRDPRTTQQNDFASLLSDSMAAGGARPDKPLAQMTEPEREAKARDTARDFVAVAFIEPILKQLRSSQIGAELAPPLGPGPGEKQFRALADSQVARQLVRAGNWPLVDRIAKSLRRKPGNPTSPESLAAAPVLPGSPADIKRGPQPATPQLPAVKTQEPAAQARTESLNLIR